MAEWDLFQEWKAESILGYLLALYVILIDLRGKTRYNYAHGKYLKTITICLFSFFKTQENNNRMTFHWYYKNKHVFELKSQHLNRKPWDVFPQKPGRGHKGHYQFYCLVLD